MRLTVISGEQGCGKTEALSTIAHFLELPVWDYNSFMESVTSCKTFAFPPTILIDDIPESELEAFRLKFKKWACNFVITLAQ